MLERSENTELPQRENAQLQTTSREVDLAWLAGIIDGEGALGLGIRIAHNNKPYLESKVRVYNTDVRMIEKVSRIYAELGVVFFYNLNKKRSENWKDQLGVCVAGHGSCLKILEAVAPYLANKQEIGNAMAAVIRYVQAQPKGGGSVARDYTGKPEFQSLMRQFEDQRALHIAPSTTTRRAGAILKI